MYTVVTARFDLSVLTCVHVQCILKTIILRLYNYIHVIQFIFSAYEAKPDKGTIILTVLGVKFK